MQCYGSSFIASECTIFTMLQFLLKNGHLADDDADAIVSHIMGNYGHGGTMQLREISRSLTKAIPGKASPR